MQCNLHGLMLKTWLSLALAIYCHLFLLHFYSIWASLFWLSASMPRPVQITNKLAVSDTFRIDRSVAKSAVPCYCWMIPITCWQNPWKGRKVRKTGRKSCWTRFGFWKPGINYLKQKGTAWSQCWEKMWLIFLYKKKTVIVLSNIDLDWSEPPFRFIQNLLRTTEIKLHIIIWGRTKVPGAGHCGSAQEKDVKHVFLTSDEKNRSVNILSACKELQ